ncbi:MAG TPA: hypothetical protein VMX96_01385 [Dehalococcoidia bacterium]|nr:hypothetical protein [Dehalococcoidia bacterium]
MAEKMEDIKSQLGSLGGRYWIFALIGALIIVATTYKPFFLAYCTTALVVLFCAIVWCLWRNAPKIARYGIALITLAAFVFLLYNSLAVLYGWSSYIHHPAEADAVTYGYQLFWDLFANDLANITTVANITAGLGGLTESTITSAIAYAMGGIGSLLFLVSGLMGIMAARRA